MFDNFSLYIPTEIFFGPGSLNKMGEIDLPGKKALIVIGGNSVKRHGYLSRLEALLSKNGVNSVIFDGIRPNPLVDDVMTAATLAKKENCDFVIGLGGGSSMDSAKSIAIMATNPGTYWDYIPSGSGKGLPMPNKPLPIICITTTAGTGTEADPWTVISKQDTHEKTGFGCRDTFPLISIVDPDLMTTVPPMLTAYQGFDALFHAIEGYIANIASPISDLFALQSIEYVVKYLAKAVKEGNNIEARSYIALANTLSGLVESTSCCTSEHALEHAMSAYAPELPHGAGLIMISLAYHKLYAPSCPDRYATLARIFGQEPTAEGFLKGLAQLQIDCGVDQLKMSDYNLSPDHFTDYAFTARDTMGNLFALDRCTFTDNDIVAILQQSYR
ncbi:MAG: iron-containing alcohol dehydrogenase [Akkermansia sp.]